MAETVGPMRNLHLRDDDGFCGAHVQETVRHLKAFVRELHFLKFNVQSPNSCVRLRFVFASRLLA